LHYSDTIGANRVAAADFRPGRIFHLTLTRIPVASLLEFS